MDSTVNGGYFDWAATSPADSEILREVLEESSKNFANPSSAHSLGMGAKKILEGARAMCAQALGVRQNQVFFTSGGTEADHIPLLSMIEKERRGKIICSAIEHPALREQCLQMRQLGFSVSFVKPDRNGFILPEKIGEELTDDTLFVAVMAVNNETGCIQPVSEIARKIEEFYSGKRKPHFHSDCVQAAGKIPLRLHDLKIDSAAFSAHKISGPRGIGLLYLRESQKFRPFLTGGGQESGVRSGTENLFGALAFSKVLKKHYIMEENRKFSELKSISRSFVESLSKIGICRIVPETRILESEKFSPTIVQAAFLGIPGNVMVRALDAKGFSISTGSACSAKKQSRPVLEAMGLSREIQDSAVRFSFGPDTTAEALDGLLGAVREVCSDFS